MSAAKMFGPYKQREDAIEAGFGHILRMGDSNKKEYAFVVALKSEDRSYCYTEPQTSSSLSYVNLNIELPPRLHARAFCHNHPDNIADPGFGSSDGRLFAEAVKNGSTLVWYLMNKFNEIRMAEIQAEFPNGKVTKLKPKS